MERRVLLAIFLSFLVLYVYQALVVKPVPKPVNGPDAQTTPAVSTPSSSEPVPTPAAPAEAATTPPKPVAQPLVTDSAERDVQIETQDVIAVFTNRGARLKSWRLKHYRDQQQQPQELIERSIPSQPLPFSLRTTDESTTSLLNSALYTVSGEPSAG